MYYKKVNKASRKEMVDFLSNHFRYDTMNSWNCSTSYAHCVKMWNLGLPRELEDKFWEMYDSENDFYDFYLPNLIRDFREEWGYDVGFNGKSGGYLVLYDAEKVRDKHLSYCTKCGQQNYTLATEENKKCGRCGCDTRVNYPAPRYRWDVYPGRSIDQNEDFNDKDEWSMNRLKQRVELVQAFDKLCDDIRDELIWYLRTHDFVDEEYVVKKTKKVAKEKELCE